MGVDPYHNQSVIARIAKDNDISLLDAERWFRGMLQFLAVAATAGAPVSPSLPIDEAWHAFILHTVDYTRFCQERFGFYLHHQPTGEGVDNTGNYLRARQLAVEQFGELDQEIWPAEPAQVAAGECSGCCRPTSRCCSGHRSPAEVAEPALASASPAPAGVSVTRSPSWAVDCAGPGGA